MTCCAYCGEQATEDIPAVPGRVCRAHAQEFWTGLLTYVRDQSTPTAQPETPCLCGACNDMSTVKLRMIAAGAAAGPPPGYTERTPTAAARNVEPLERIAAHESAASRDGHDSTFADSVNFEAPGAVTDWRVRDADVVRTA